MPTLNDSDQPLPTNDTQPKDETPNGISRRTVVKAAWVVPAVVALDLKGVRLALQQSQGGGNGGSGGTTIRIESSQLNYNAAGGWGGWSAPNGKTVVAGGIVWITPAVPVQAQGIAKPLASIGGYTYPTFPHYTFPAGEEGYVVQLAPGNSASLKIWLEYLA